MTLIGILEWMGKAQEATTVHQEPQATEGLSKRNRLPKEEHTNRLSNARWLDPKA